MNIAKHNVQEYGVHSSERLQMPHQCSTISSSLYQADIAPCGSVRNLGAVFDSKMSMESQVGAVCRSVRYHLHNIGKIRRFLTRQACEDLVHALVTSRLDMYNGLLYGLPQYLIDRLQRCQNVAARIIMCRKRSCHITPVLHELHWLPVSQRIRFKILVQVYRALNNLAPAYIEELLSRYTPTRALKSTDSFLLCVPRTRTNWGDRAFSKAGPVLWNGLPPVIKTATSLAAFKTRLKTLLFQESYA